MRHTNQALGGFEANVKLPESRDFYWSKIRREIERPASARAEPAATPWWARARQWVVGSAAAALLVLAGLVASRGLWGGGSGYAIETDLADPKAFTYRDYSARTTLVWLSYPADNEVAQMTPASTLP